MDELNTAIKAAKLAGKVIMEHYGKENISRTMKGKADFATVADYASEKVILETIRKDFPGHSILAEEKGKIEEDSEYRWIIDPIDGTHNFALGLPAWSVGIALEKKGELILGVAFAPHLNRLYYAEKGKGAFLNGKKISVSENDYPNCWIDFDALWAIERFPEVKKHSERVSLEFKGNLRMFGSSVFASTAVASANLDAYIGFGQNPWDIAPGLILVKEAGGMVSDIHGKHVNVNSTTFVLSNKKIHKRILGLFKD